MSDNKVFSGLALMPKGTASENLIHGALVLEGGSFRGLYTAGVLDALMEAGINFDYVIGTSAGALNGMNYVSGQIGRAGRLNLEYRHDSRLVGRKALLENGGVIGFDFMLGDIEDYPFDLKRFNDENRRFVATATCVEDGKGVFFEKGKCSDIMKGIQASASMPIFSKMVEIDGKHYLDGGCANKIPFQKPIDEGYDKVVVVRTRIQDFVKPDMPEAEKLAFNRAFHNYPEFCASFTDSDNNYNRQTAEINRQARRGRIFQICPSRHVDISRLEGDVEKLGQLYYLGYQDGRKAIPALLEYLEKDK